KEEEEEEEKEEEEEDDEEQEEEEFDQLQLADLQYETSSTFMGLLKTHILHVSRKIDPAIFLIWEKQRACAILHQDFLAQLGLKFSIVLSVEMSKIDLSSGQRTSTTSYFQSRTQTVLRAMEIENLYENCVLKINDNIANFNQNGSNFTVERVISFQIHSVGYNPLRHAGASYFPLPPEIQAKKCCLNIKSFDDRCFLYCLLLSLNLENVNVRRACVNPSILLQFSDQLRMNGVKYPVTLNQISKVENMNKIAITVIGYRPSVGFFPLRTSKALLERDRKRIDLLYIKRSCVGDEAESEADSDLEILDPETGLREDTSPGHFVLIKNLDKLLSKCKSKKHGSKFICRNCWYQTGFSDLLREHEQHCLTMACQRIEFPKEGKNLLAFKNHKALLMRPYLCIADFECFIRPNDSQHIPFCVAYIILGEDGSPLSSLRVLFGEDCASKFLTEIKEYHEALEKSTHAKIKPLTSEQTELMQNPNTLCGLCKESVPKQLRCAHHSHVTGEFLGLMCRSCNLRLQLVRDMPILFHGGGNYDFLLITRALEKVVEKKDDIKIIAKSSERFTCIQWGRLKFIDSFNLLGESLANFASILENEDFRITKTFFPESEKFSLVTAKMPFPYKYFTGMDVLAETSLPPQDAYDDDLSQTPCSSEKYEKAKKIWQTFGLKNLRELVSLYIRTDVCLLSDCVQSFRFKLFEKFGMDLAHFISLPSYSWTACLKTTALEVELLTDGEMYRFFERASFGGFVTVANQHARANNKLCSSYDPSKPTSWLLYWDATSLYGSRMYFEKFPTGSFKFLSEQEVQNFDFENVDCEEEWGFLIEATFSFPPEIHDYLNCYPPCPEKLLIDCEELSDRSKLIATLLDVNLNTKVKKLVATLHPHVNYVLPLKNLQTISKLGVRIDKITRILTFKQARILAPFVELCTKMRKEAKSKLESDVAKKIINSTFGFTLKNQLKERDIRLVYNKKQLSRLVGSTLFERATTFGESSAIVEMRRPVVNLTSPIFIGIQILAFSKNTMVDFWYNQIKKEFGEKATLCLSDTDSVVFLLEKESHNIYETDLIPKFGHLLDTSNFDPSSPFFSLERKKKLGGFCDEMGGKILEEVVALKPKSYSCKVKQTKLLVRSKGVPKSVQQRFTFDDYKKCLTTIEPLVVNFKMIGRKRQRLYTMSCSKIGLSSFDSKRYWLDEKYKSLAFGHKRINRAGISSL
ncbi:hypothetical protein KUF71_012426, partial [Frankliniella fusca]